MLLSATHLSPGEKSVTDLPTFSMTPTTSCPGINYTIVRARQNHHDGVQGHALAGNLVMNSPSDLELQQLERWMV